MSFSKYLESFHDQRKSSSRCAVCRSVRLTQLDSHYLRLATTVQSPGRDMMADHIQFINAHCHIDEAAVMDKLVASVQSKMTLGECLHLGMCATAVGRWGDAVLSHLDLQQCYIYIIGSQGLFLLFTQIFALYVSLFIICLQIKCLS